MTITRIHAALAAFLLLAVVSCSGGEEGATKDGSGAPATSGVSIDSTPVRGDWLIYNLSSEPGTLNPITATDAYESIINSNIYETLVKRDPDSLEIVPLLAESWDISADKLTYTFKLRGGVKWQDGTPFTSADVIYSFERIMDPAVDSAHLKNYLKDVTKVEALDTHTVRFTYSKPYFLALEVCGGMSIVPMHIFSRMEDDVDFNSHPAGREPIGTGPYRFLRWDTGKEVVLTRNVDYWGEQPYLDRIIYKIITDSTVSLQVLKRGDIDVAGLSAIQWEKQTSSKGFNASYSKLSYFRPNYSYIGWNTQKSLFSDAVVRRAMSHFLDREMILKKILFDLGVVITNPFFVNSPEYDKSITPITFDPAKGAELLDLAGWIDTDGDGIRDKDGGKFEFEFLIPNGSDTGEKIATIYKERLSRHGIEMNIRKTEWAVFVQRLQEHKFDAVTLAWSMGVESDPYQIWHSSQTTKGSNFVGFTNKRADEIIEEARTEFDRQKRIELYREFSRIVHEEQPYTFLYCRKSTVAVNRRFHGVVVHPLGLETLEWYVPLALQKYTLPGS